MSIAVSFHKNSNSFLVANVFYNPSQNIWRKVKKYSKIVQDFKNIISKFACSFSHILPTFNLYKEDWTLGCVSTHIWHFSNISEFPKILSLKLFGNSCTKFVMLNFKYRFTFRYSDLSQIIITLAKMLWRGL